MGEFLYCPCGSQVPELLTTRQLGLLALGGGSSSGASHQDDASVRRSHPSVSRNEKLAGTDLAAAAGQMEGGVALIINNQNKLIAGQNGASAAVAPKLLKLYQVCQPPA